MGKLNFGDMSAFNHEVHFSRLVLAVESLTTNLQQFGWPYLPKWNRVIEQ
jgi:hypothetical protein